MQIKLKKTVESLSASTRSSKIGLGCLSQNSLLGHSVEFIVG